MPPTTLARRKKKARLSAPAALTNGNGGGGGLLPTDVLYEVLLRVPAKELCRARLVCRSWRSLTSDPGFARAHAPRHPLLVAAGIRSSTEVHLLDLSGNVVRRLHAPERVYDVMSTDDDLGLLCVSPVIGSLSYLVDPVTGDVVATLPDGAEDVDLEQGDGDGSSFPWSVLRQVLRRRQSYGWSSPTLVGHVPSTGEYKALRTNGYGTALGEGLYGGRIEQTCNVITLGAAAAAAGGRGSRVRWRARPCPPVGRSSSCLRDRVVLNGVAYFLRSPSNHSYSEDGTAERDAIFAFDLATEEWRRNTVRGPLSSNSDGEHELSGERREESLLQLCVLGGCLVMAAHHKNSRDCSTDLWFLDADDRVGIWTKRYSIDCAPSCREHASSRPPCPLHVLEDGRIVMWGEGVLGVYDPRTDMYAKLASMKEYGSVRMHLGSLLFSGLRQS